MKITTTTLKKISLTTEGLEEYDEKTYGKYSEMTLSGLIKNLILNKLGS